MLPNWLTASRVLMALVFFGVLTFWRWEDSLAQSAKFDWLLAGAAALFGVAVATDALDGYLARRWKTESMFGRIMDPFADKILVVGAFVFLAGPDFWCEFPADAPVQISGHGIQLSGVYPWMVVVIMGRELLVTSIRGVLEGQGIQFASDWWGKGKMILQSIAIPLVLLIMASVNVNPEPRQAFADQPWGRLAIDGLVWVMLAVTLMSGLPYVVRCVRILGQWQREKKLKREGAES